MIQNKQQLYKKLMDEWRKTKPEIFRNFIDLIPNRIKAKEGQLSIKLIV